MRRILLVEGSDSRPPGAEATALSGLWGAICEAVAVPRFDRVEPIDKGLIERLTEGDAALDEEIVRLALCQPDDAIVVAWDARPPWLGATADVCRWRETVSLYRRLDERRRLPAPFHRHVQARRLDLEGRNSPHEKHSPPVRLAPGSLHAVCMEPMFEGLFCEEKVIRQALFLTGQEVKDWPKKWTRRSQLEAKSLLDQAIHAARRHNPRPAIVRQIGLDYTRNQESWAAHFIRYFATSWPDRFGEQAVVQRLRILLAI